MKVFHLFLVVVGLALVGCQKSETDGVNSSLQKPPEHGIGLLANSMVTGPNGEALAGAKVFVGNVSSGRQVLTTDAQGSFAPPADWKTPETVSVTAAGYTRATYYHQLPRGQSFQLHTADTIPSYEIKGVTTGFDPYKVEKDGFVDFALVMPMMKREELYFFNENQVMSPENDYLSVFGQKIPVPSNVSLPLQKEKYGFITVTIDKPAYHFKVSKLGEQQFVAIRAKSTVAALKDRLPPLELLNKVEAGGGALRTAVVTATGAALDFAIGEVQFGSKLTVTAPALPSDMIMLSLPLSKSGEFLYPSDVKSMKSKESRQLSVMAAGASDLLSVVTSPDRKNRAASATMNSINASTPNLQFLGMVSTPTGDMQSLKVTPPTTPSGVEPAGMYVTLSKVDIKELDDIQYETETREWELYFDTWNDNLVVPQLPPDMSFSRARNVQYRWEVSFMAREASAMAFQSTSVLRNLVKDVSYVSRNSTDL